MNYQGNKREIATEYKEFVDVANELAEKDDSKYPLEKRVERHLIGMIELYSIRYGGVNNLRTRLQAFKDISQWLTRHLDSEVIILSDLEDYVNTSIKDLQADLDSY